MVCLLPRRRRAARARARAPPAARAEARFLEWILRSDPAPGAQIHESDLARQLEPQKKKPKAASASASASAALASRLGTLSAAQWTALMAGAERRRCRDGEVVLEEGAEARGDVLTRDDCDFAKS